MPPVISLALQIQPVIFIITVAASSSSSAVCLWLGLCSVFINPFWKCRVVKWSRDRVGTIKMWSNRSISDYYNQTLSSFPMLIIPLPQVLIGIAFHNTWEEEFPASHLTLPFDFLRLPYPSFSRWGGPGGTIPCTSGWWTNLYSIL